MINIVMINQPLNNRGDESAHRGLLRAILGSGADVKITVLFFGDSYSSIKHFMVDDPRIEYITHLYHFHFAKRILNYIYSHIYNDVIIKEKGKWLWKITPGMNRLYRIIDNADLILNAPGGICMGGFQNWGHVKKLGMAKLFGKPIAYYGRSFGPFPTVNESNRKFKEYSLRMLNYISFLAIRDRKTEELADSLGLKYVSTVDSAFLDSPHTEIPLELKSQIGTKPYIVFVPNLLIWHYAYKEKITQEEILQFYVRMTKVILTNFPDYNIIMLPQTFLYGDYLNDDINLFNDIACEVKDNHIHVIDDKYSSDIQQTIIQGAKLLIGARYHSIVFALNNNVPFIALSYEHKIAGLLETLSKTDCMVDISEDITTTSGRDRIIEKTSELMHNVKPDKNAQLKAKQIASRCFDLFKTKYLADER